MKTRWSELSNCSKALLLFSGGFDSTYVGASLVKRGIEVFPLSFEYLNRPFMEREVARKISKRLFSNSVKTIELGLNDYRNDPSEWTSNRTEGWIPYRNVVFVSLAAHFAHFVRADIIALGVRVWDTSALNDATADYFKKIEDLISITGDKEKKREFEIFLPIINSDSEIKEAMRRDKSLRETLEDTWSCWRNNREPCGECAPCVTRATYLNST